MPVSVMQCSLGRVADRIGAALDLHQRRQEEEDRRNEIKIEWQHCALVIDRFLVWIEISRCSLQSLYLQVLTLGFHCSNHHCYF